MSTTEVKTKATGTLGEKIHGWIVDRINDGLTVYATNYLTSVKITKASLPMVRVSKNGRHCEVQHGKRWDSINGCKITAS